MSPGVPQWGATRGQSFLLRKTQGTAKFVPLRSAPWGAPQKDVLVHSGWENSVNMPSVLANTSTDPSQEYTLLSEKRKPGILPAPWGTPPKSPYESHVWRSAELTLVRMKFPLFFYVASLKTTKTSMPDRWCLSTVTTQGTTLSFSAEEKSTKNSSQILVGKPLTLGESNMHRIEVHHFASPFAPNFPVGENSVPDIHTRDSVEIVGFPIETGRFPVPENGKFPFEKRGAKATRNGDHNLVHV